MPGTVTIVVAPPMLGRAGRLQVEVNSVKVGKVRQGASLELTLHPGVHRFRVWGGGYHSRAVSLSVADDSQQQLYAGVRFGAPLISALATFALLYFAGILTFVIVAASALIPGHYYYLRPTAASPSAEALEDAEEAAAAATTGEPWWVNDPNLAKRYRKG